MYLHPGGNQISGDHVICTSIRPKTKFSGYHGGRLYMYDIGGGNHIVFSKISGVVKFAFFLFLPGKISKFSKELPS